MGRILTFNHKIINPGNNRYFGTFRSGPTPQTASGSGGFNDSNRIQVRLVKDY